MGDRQWPLDPGRPRLPGLAPGLEGRTGGRGELEGSGSQQLIGEIGGFYSEKLCLGSWFLWSALLLVALLEELCCCRWCCLGSCVA